MICDQDPQNPFEFQLKNSPPDYPLFCLVVSNNDDLAGYWVTREQAESFLLSHSLLQYQIATGFPIFTKAQ